eukprot:m.183305 g.183305  ORF g.183305 m.183305 type:complete len:507 (-) comp18077_c1_seq3:99-1619(-)
MTRCPLAPRPAHACGTAMRTRRRNILLLVSVWQWSKKEARGKGQREGVLPSADTGSGAESAVRHVSWNADGTILAVTLAEQHTTIATRVQVWLASASQQLMLKQELVYSGQEAVQSVQWDCRDPLQLNVATSEGRAICYRFSLQGDWTAQGQQVAVVDGAILRLVSTAACLESAQLQTTVAMPAPCTSLALSATCVAFTTQQDIFVASRSDGEFTEPRALDALTLLCQAEPTLATSTGMLLRHATWFEGSNKLVVAVSADGEPTDLVALVDVCACEADAGDATRPVRTRARISRVAGHVFQLHMHGTVIVAQLADGSLWAMRTSHFSEWKPWLLGPGMNALSEPCSQLKIVDVGDPEEPCALAVSESGTLFMDAIQALTGCDGVFVIADFIIVAAHRRCMFLPKWLGLSRLQQDVCSNISYEETLPAHAAVLIGVTPKSGHLAFVAKDGETMELVPSPLLQIALTSETAQTDSSWFQRASTTGFVMMAMAYLQHIHGHGSQQQLVW